MQFHFNFTNLLYVSFSELKKRGGRKMKKLALAVLSVITLASISMANPTVPANNPAAQQKFQAAKQRVLSNIQQRQQILQQRLQFLQQKQNCIQNAQSFKDMKNCQMQFKEEIQSPKGQQGVQK